MTIIIIKFIAGILILCVIAILGWGVWTLVNNPTKIKELLLKAADSTRKEEHENQRQEEYRPLQEDTIRSIVKEEIERMGNKIIRSFPQSTNISQSDIINEIRYNRQLLEQLVSLNKGQEKTKPEPVKISFQQYPITKYARMVDSSSPLGFRMASLSDVSNSACYQIQINSETKAYYRLITDLTMQKEIIAMFNPIITSGCEYEENPTAINQIIHTEDGLLELHSGVWHIVQKAKIKFI